MAIDPPYRFDPFQNLVNIHWHPEGTSGGEGGPPPFLVGDGGTFYVQSVLSGYYGYHPPDVNHYRLWVSPDGSEAYNGTMTGAAPEAWSIYMGAARPTEFSATGGGSSATWNLTFDDPDVPNVTPYSMDFGGYSIDDIYEVDHVEMVFIVGGGMGLDEGYQAQIIFRLK